MRKLYCAFIDFEKTIDAVWHMGLWNKILISNIDRTCFRIPTDMQKRHDTKVMANGPCSEWFQCTVGIRQGENSFPFSIAWYLNDRGIFKFQQC